VTLLGAAEIRELAALLDLKPSKSLGQNFVIDARRMHVNPITNAVLETHLTFRWNFQANHVRRSGSN